MSILRQVVAHFLVEADDSALTKLDQGIGNVKAGLLALGAAIGASKIAGFVNDMAGAADDLGDASERLQISTNALQEWGFAAEQSGSSSEEFAGSISHLVRSLSEASDAGSEQAATFKKLGVNVKDAHGNLRSVDDILPELADGIAAIEDPTERSALAMRVLGRGTIGLVPLLSRGSAGVGELRQEFQKLGGGISPEAVELGSEYADTLNRLNAVVTSLKSRALVALLPAFQWLADNMQRAGEIVIWITDKTYLLEGALTTAGLAATAFAISWVSANRAVLVSTLQTWGPLLLKFGLAAAGVAAVVLIVEDLVSLFSGGKSAIGEFVDSIFGLGAADETVINLKRGFEELVYWAARGAEALTGNFDGEGLETPEQAVERRRNEAVASGNVDAFVADRAYGQSRDEGRGSFLEHRRRYLVQNPQAVTDADRNEGIAPPSQATTPAGTRPAAGAVATAPRAGRAPSQVKQENVTNIHLPPGSDREQVERIRKVVSEENDKRTRQAAAALESVAP